MSEIAKLKKLLDHWIEHNNEHAETYRKWADRSAALGHHDLSALLKKISQETIRLNALFEEASKKIDAPQD